MTKPNNLCLAPWTHTYLSPQTERRMCCASREPAQNFRQYIDTKGGTGRYIPLTLEDHWNGDHMRSVRRRMLAGEVLPECEVCNDKLLNMHVYRTYFDQMFGHKWPQVQATTDSTGATTMRPVSWDYRFSNLCNFKCRMCGDKLSSQWETDMKKIHATDPNWLQRSENAWMQPEIKAQITQFQDTQIEKEFSDAVEQHRVEEVYWVGGEPLMYEQHWRYMKRIIELGDGPNVYARYNTNLSRVVYRGIDLYDDILANLRDYQICASLDGTGAVGEYIRTGLKFDEWKQNFARGVAVQKSRRQMRIDFTLTLPGMTDLINMVRLAKEFRVDMLTKICFAFDPSIAMSPQILPRRLLDAWVDDLVKEAGMDISYIGDLVNQLRNQPCFEEKWPNTYQAGLVQAKRNVNRYEEFKGDTYRFADILAQRPEVAIWWESIEC